FRQLLSFLSASGVRPVIDRVFSLKEAAAAQQRLEEGKQFGKIVLQVTN
ncbi:MAG: zinc-binding dehydrogenase, partial [Candidatus Binatia bacterium]